MGQEGKEGVERGVWRTLCNQPPGTSLDTQLEPWGRACSRRASRQNRRRPVGWVALGGHHDRAPTPLSAAAYPVRRPPTYLQKLVLYIYLRPKLRYQPLTA